MVLATLGWGISRADHKCLNFLIEYGKMFELSLNIIISVPHFKLNTDLESRGFILLIIKQPFLQLC